MKILRAIQTTFLLSVLLLMSNCSRTISEQTENKISPPFKNVDVAYTENTIDPSTGGVIKLENGTRINLPKDAFINSDGKLVKSKVKIKYREFHNSAQILMSGIPMKFGNENFQTAGMFEIKGTTEKDIPVQIAKEAAIRVEMASFTTGDEYSFYYFNEQEGQWILKGTSTAQENEEKKLKLKSLPEIAEAPLKPIKQQENSLVFDLEVNAALYPELNDFKDVVWQYAGSDPEKNPEKTPWVFTNQWSFVELQRISEEGNTYSLHLSDRKRDFTTIVSPVLNGRHYRQALARFQKKLLVYENALAAQKAEIDQLSREADLLRTFEINNFGIYNWDCFYNKQEFAIKLNADFKFDKEIPGVDLKNISFYLVTGNQRAVITYNFDTKNNFTFNPNDENKLIAVLPGNRIAYFRNEDFKTMLNSINASGNSNFTFVLKVADNEVVNAENLCAVISSI